MNLLGYKLKALDFWGENGHTLPHCDCCDNTIPWGDGFMLDEAKFMCNPCIERTVPFQPNQIG